MKDFGIACAVGLTVIAGLGIGAYLVMNDHPWFGLLVLLMVGSIRVKTD